MVMISAIEPITSQSSCRWNWYQGDPYSSFDPTADAESTISSPTMFKITINANSPTNKLDRRPTGLTGRSRRTRESEPVDAFSAETLRLGVAPRVRVAGWRGGVPRRVRGGRTVVVTT